MRVFKDSSTDKVSSPIFFCENRRLPQLSGRAAGIRAAGNAAATRDGVGQTIAERLAPCGTRTGECRGAILPSAKVFGNRHMSKPSCPSQASLPVRLAAVVAVCIASTAAAGVAWAVAADAHITPPRDTPYPGTIQIAVDASDTRQGIFRVHEVIPVRSGKLTLLYPKWIPGNHSPSGPIAMLAGLTIRANGTPVVWTRDKYDVYAF